MEFNWSTTSLAQNLAVKEHSSFILQLHGGGWLCDSLNSVISCCETLKWPYTFFAAAVDRRSSPKVFLGNMRQRYKRTPMPKCDFNKVALQYPILELARPLRYPTDIHGRWSKWNFEACEQIKLPYNKFILVNILAYNNFIWTKKGVIIDVDIWIIKTWNSHPVVFLGKSVLEICSKFTGEYPC